MAKASGGDQEFVDGGFQYHVFETSGTLTVSESIAAADILCVAGGGGGGFESDPDFGAGGGGAGGVILLEDEALAVASYAVTVGSGGAGATDDTASGGDGTGSDFDTTIVSTTGGGGGASFPNDGRDGGSGGGAVDTVAAGSGTAGEGSDGGVATGHCSGGGGGGKTAVGGDGFASSGGDGGDGLSVFGGLFVVGGGGGGGAAGPGTCGGSSEAGAGGTGGGGTGAESGTAATAGTANTGGGGGGGSGFSGVNDGGSGGTGVVVVRYETDDVDAELAGTLPAVEGSFTASIDIDAALAGTFPALTGAVSVAVGEIDAELAGTLPALAGAVDVELSGDVDAELAGTLPALSGAASLKLPLPEPAVPATWAPTTEQILDLDGVHRRSDRFRFELLDQQDRVIGEVRPDRNRAPQIRNNTGSAVHRTMSNFHLPFDQVEDINTVRDRVRPVMVLQNGDEFPLGVFLWADENRPERGWGPEHASSLVDKGLMLNQPAIGSMSWGAGADPVLILLYMALRSLTLDEIFPAESVGTLTEPVAWNHGTRWLQAMSDIHEMVGFTSPWFDRDGILHMEEPPDPSTQTPITAYGPGNRIVQDTIVQSDDLLEAPNVFSVHETGSESTIVGRYELPATAPHSVSNRGFEIALTESVQGLASQRNANRAARNMATSAGVAFDWVTFEATADPRHDTWDVVEFEGVNWVETEWRLTCRSGVPMQHTLRRVHN